MDEEYACPDCNRIYPTSQTCDCWIVWSDEEIYNDDLNKCIGICSDYIINYK